MSSRNLAKITAKLGPQIDHRLHQRGWELWRSGTQPAAIRKALKITTPQWRWLLEVGDEDAIPPMPSYQTMLVHEIATIRSSASEAAVDLAVDGVKVLRQRTRNAQLANDLIHGILEHTAHQLLAMKADGDTDPNALISMCMPRGSTQEMLKILARFADMGTVAHAFRTIYGDVAAQRALYPVADAPKGGDGNPFNPGEGEGADRESFLPKEMVSEVVVEMSEWSDKQVKAFADGDDEPPPNL